MAGHRIALQPDIAEIPRLLDWVESRCAADAVPGDIALKLALALEEAVANIIHHGFRDAAPPHRIELRLDIAAGTLIAEVIDNAAPFDPTYAPEADTTLPLEERSLGGLGIRLINTMMDRVEYRRAGGENRLRLEKRLG
jgi:anti-sigma regulatory factor (Ser/Thr protein kinase)